MKVNFIDQEVDVEIDSFDWDDFELQVLQDDVAVGMYMDQLVEVDRDMYEFLNAPENNQEPWEMGDTHEYLEGGLTHDKQRDLQKWQHRMRQEEDFNGPNKTLGV